MKGLNVIQCEDGKLYKGTTQDYIDYVINKSERGIGLIELTEDEIEIYKYGFEMGKRAKSQ